MGNSSSKKQPDLPSYPGPQGPWYGTNTSNQVSGSAPAMASSATKAEGRELETKNLLEALRALKGEDGKGDVVVLNMGGADIGAEGAKEIGEALKSNGTLTSLHLGFNKIGDEGAKAIGEALKSNGTLTSLNLDGNRIGNEGSRAIGEALKSNGTLTRLDLKNNDIRNDGTIAILASLRDNKSSLHLEIGRMSIQKKESAHTCRLTGINIGVDEGRAIAAALKSHGTLTILELKGNTSVDRIAKAIIGALKSNETLTSLHLEGTQIGAEGAQAIGEALKSNGTLTGLDLRHNQIEDKGAKAIGEALKVNATLTSLDLGGNEIGAEGVKVIGEALKSNGTLASLNIRENGIDDEGAKAIGEALKSNGTLTSLNLGYNQIGDEGAHAIGEALKSNGTLTWVNLEFNQIGAEGAKAVGEALKSNGTLTTLYLGANRLGDEGAKAIGEGLKSNGTLTSLHLELNQIGAEGAKAIGEAVKSNGTLTSLDLFSNKIGDEGAKAIGEGLKVNGTLTSLELRENHIGDEGAKAIGEALKSNETLNSLRLDSNRIGDEGAKTIGEALKSNGALTSLDLSFNRIGAEGAKAIGKALKSNGTLTSLYLGYNQIGDEGAKAIGEALKSNGTLTSMSLVKNEIGVGGAKAIGEALKVNATLTSLDLYGNEIGNEEAKAIGEALKVNETSTSLHVEGNEIEDDEAEAIGEEEEEEEEQEQGEEQVTAVAMNQPAVLGVEDELCMAPAMDGFIPVDFSQSELKVIHKLDGRQVVSSWKDLKTYVKKALDKKYRSTGEIESAMQPPHPKAGDSVDEISNPHLIQYSAGHGRTKKFVCTWDVYDDGNANDKEFLGMKDVKIYENEEEELQRSKMTEEEEARYDEWKEKCRRREFDRRKAERNEIDFSNDELEPSKLPSPTPRDERDQFDFGYIREGIQEDKDKRATDGIVRHFTDEPPRPTKPLRTKDGRVPKIGLLVLSEFSGWASTYFFLKPVDFAYPFATLLQRIEYAMRLFEGCEVELILCHTTISHGFKDALEEFVQKTGAVLFDLLCRDEVYAYLLDRKEKFNFGLMINIRSDRADAGMGYGFEECDERYLLRALGLASKGNFMFGDWGCPGDGGYRGPEDETDLEYAGAYDSSAYMDWELKVQHFRFAGEPPIHARPLARLIRLGRFMRPILARRKSLRRKDIERIWGGVRGDYFSEANVWATWWATYSGLLFAEDLMYHPYHKWRFPPLQWIQHFVADQWLEFQGFYWNSFEQEWADALLSAVKRVRQTAGIVILACSAYLVYFLCQSVHEYSGLYEAVRAAENMFLSTDSCEA